MGFALPWASHNHIGWGAVVQEDCSSCFLAFFTWNILVIHLVGIAYLEGTWLGRQDMHIRVWTGLGWTEEESEGYFLSSFYTNYLTALDG